jgi:signal transduction histidine kinase
LVNDILDYRQARRGQARARGFEVRIEPLLQGVCELLSTRAHGKAIVIRLGGDAGLPHPRDEGRCARSLFNLAGNAVKFTAEAACC